MKERFNRLRQKGAEYGVTKENVALVWMVAIVSLSLVAGVTTAQEGSNFDFVESHDISSNTAFPVGVDYYNGSFYVADENNFEIDVYNSQWEYQESVNPDNVGLLAGVEVVNGTLYAIEEVDEGDNIAVLDAETLTQEDTVTASGNAEQFTWNGTHWLGTGGASATRTIEVYDENFNLLRTETAEVKIYDMHKPSGSVYYYATAKNDTIYRLNPDWTSDGNFTVENPPDGLYHGITHAEGNWYLSDPGDDAVYEFESELIDERETKETALTLKHDRYMEFGSTQEYEVVYNNGTQRRAVTGSANVTVSSNNTSVVAFNGDGTMTATTDENVSVRVTTTANYTLPNGTTITDTNYVAVAKPDVENLEVLPPLWRFSASIGSPTIQAILVAVLMGVFAGRIAGAFAGLGMMQLVMVAGWFIGYVGVGMAMISLFTALFIGLNMAANIDYTVTR